MGTPKATDRASPRATRRGPVRRRIGVEASKTRGRPRDAQRHAAILEATRQLILEVGYSSLTIDAIAKRAGASRTTIYEWWGHRAPLVQEAIFSSYESWPLPDTGSLDGDLDALVRELVREMTRPEVMRAFPSLTAEFQSKPELKSSAITLYGAPMTRRWQDVFARAVARGELAPTASAETTMHLVLGALWMMSHNKTLPRRRLAPYLLRATRAVLSAEPSA